MAEQLLPPFYRDIPELKPLLLYDVNLTGRQLGIGSFGVVEELRYGGTICAGKKLHENLMDFRDEGVQKLVEKFVSECCLMSDLRHPNIVQFLGLSFLKHHRHPILVMECLDINLDDLLEDDNSIDLPSKFAILLDVAKGLEYLHNRKTPVIHRDLTTRNVLLNRKTLHAKIGDLGNSLLIDRKEFTRTLSRNPGTTVYMPPEATGYTPCYDATLDMFSFGQLSLHTIINVFPGDLLPATVCDPVTEVITGRSELERREEYSDILNTLLDLDHPFNVCIRRCLSNLPGKRYSPLPLPLHAKSEPFR
jgi:serine/threonine protein kinase